MMEMRSQPASFSKSLRMVIWKATDTRQWRILGGGGKEAGAQAPARTATCVHSMKGKNKKESEKKSRTCREDNSFSEMSGAEPLSRVLSGGGLMSSCSEGTLFNYPRGR